MESDARLKAMKLGFAAALCAITEALHRRGSLSRTETLAALRETLDAIDNPRHPHADLLTGPVRQLIAALERPSPDPPDERRWTPEVLQGGRRQDD